jgi:hypothetical protein
MMSMQRNYPALSNSDPIEALDYQAGEEGAVQYVSLNNPPRGA